MSKLPSTESAYSLPFLPRLHPRLPKQICSSPLPHQHQRETRPINLCSFSRMFSPPPPPPPPSSSPKAELVPPRSSRSRIREVRHLLGVRQLHPQGNHSFCPWRRNNRNERTQKKGKDTRKDMFCCLIISRRKPHSHREITRDGSEHEKWSSFVFRENGLFFVFVKSLLLFHILPFLIDSESEWASSFRQLIHFEVIPSPPPHYTESNTNIHYTESSIPCRVCLHL